MLGEEWKKKPHSARWRDAEQELLCRGINPKSAPPSPLTFRLPKVVESAEVGLVKRRKPILPPLLPS